MTVNRNNLSRFVSVLERQFSSLNSSPSAEAESATRIPNPLPPLPIQNHIFIYSTRPHVSLNNLRPLLLWSNLKKNPPQHLSGLQIRHCTRVGVPPPRPGTNCDRDLRETGIGWCVLGFVGVFIRVPSATRARARTRRPPPSSCRTRSSGAGAPDIRAAARSSAAGHSWKRACLRGGARDPT